jgi:hypothetical protein
MNEESLIQAFLEKEIRSKGLGEFFVAWLKAPSHHSTSGNEYYLEIEGDEITIGDLFNDQLDPIKIYKKELIDLINNKIYRLKE